MHFAGINHKLFFSAYGKYRMFVNEQYAALKFFRNYLQKRMECITEKPDTNILKIPTHFNRKIYDNKF